MPDVYLDLIHADCMSILPQLGSETVDLLAVDLPFEVTALPWDVRLPMEAMWEQFRRIITPNGVIVLNAAQPFSSALVTAAPDLFKYALVWHKSRPTSHLKCRNRPLSDHEDVLIFSKGAVVDADRSDRRMTYNPVGAEDDCVRTRRRVKTRAYGKCTSAKIGEDYMSKKNYPRSVLFHPNPVKPFHPTQKPETLMESLVQMYSNPGDMVVDCCMGSGTAGIAALRHGRAFLGIEADRAYYDHAQARILEEFPEFTEIFE